MGDNIEKNISAKQSEKKTNSWVPASYEHQGRSECDKTQEKERQEKPYSMILHTICN